MNIDEVKNSSTNVLIYFNSFLKHYRNKYSNGLMLFYQNGKVKGEMMFKDIIPPARLAYIIQTHLRAIATGLEVFGKHFKYEDNLDRPLIYTSSSFVPIWIQNQSYKQVAFQDDTKIRLHSLLRLFNPEFRLYDATDLSAIRDVVHVQNREIKQKIYSKEFFNFEDLNITSL